MTAFRKMTAAALTLDAAPFAIRAERASDVVAREALLDASFGEGRHARTCQRLRDGRMPAEGLAFSAVHEGRLVGTVRLWHVSAGAFLRWCSALWLWMHRAARSASARR
jgi:predicted N-acetyltransferase YhbS